LVDEQDAGVGLKVDAGCFLDDLKALDGDVGLIRKTKAYEIQHGGQDWRSKERVGLVKMLRPKFWRGICAVTRNFLEGYIGLRGIENAPHTNDCGLKALDPCRLQSFAGQAPDRQPDFSVQCNHPVLDTSPRNHLRRTNQSEKSSPNITSSSLSDITISTVIMADKKSAYGAPAGDTDFRKTWDLDEYAEKAKKREAAEREEAKARYEAKLAGKKYYKPLTGNEEMTSARRAALDVSAMVGKTQLVVGGAGQGKRGRSAGFYCEACDMTFKDNKQFVEHMNTAQHLAASGQKMEVKRATAEEVRERIDYWWAEKEDLEKQKATSLQERLELRKEEDAREAEERRQKRKEAEERKRAAKAEAEKARTAYGEDVRIEGEHDEDDMMAAMGITGFGSSRKK